MENLQQYAIKENLCDGLGCMMAFPKLEICGVDEKCLSQGCVPHVLSFFLTLQVVGCRRPFTAATTGC
jgi:hypothetical protein